MPFFIDFISVLNGYICARQYDKYISMDVVFEILPLIAMLSCLGAVAGFMAGLLGVGGGIILVPGLYYIFNIIHTNMGFDPMHLMHISVGTSLAIIVPTGFSSAMAHHRRGGVDFGLLRNIGGGIVVGVIISTWIATGLNALSMKIIFASAILILAIIMIIGRSKLKVSNPHAPKQPYVSVAGILIGGVSTLIGIGGATLSVPYMSMHGISMHRAVGSASALGLIIAIPAAIGFMIIGWGQENLPSFSIGYVNYLAWIFIIPASVAFAPLGAHIAHKISVRRLRVIFAIFMIIVALNMWRKILLVE